ncbi:hypothetical protein PEX2_076080 [Penicillium expansum]|uniref:Uncharacterized protein n=1 Tax=Penicillium expansum TaxID=27334 RepID=A0A0A2IFJ0_PENEN|nr:hypothetical protein PEX2_076080 [Penicillium expansum]KGO41892.1 hypothetical protein PEXP_108980 [Penicillium expansum]KGO56655.1 hypothetical protein PEX2_076080 [Penicillium expansum]
MRQDLEERPEKVTRSNWKSWKNAIEKHARKEGVWKYCNPDAPGEYYAEIHEPEKPHISTARPEVKSIVELGEDDFIELSSIVDQYWKQMRGYENIQTKLQVILELIEDHVDDEHFDLIKHAKTPLEQMTVLSDKFKKFRLEDLQPRWERIQELANKPDSQELFKLWNALFTDCDGTGLKNPNFFSRGMGIIALSFVHRLDGSLSLPRTGLRLPEILSQETMEIIAFNLVRPLDGSRSLPLPWAGLKPLSVLNRGTMGIAVLNLVRRLDGSLITSLQCTEALDHSKSSNSEDDYTEFRSPARREPESTTSLNFIETRNDSELRNYSDSCAQLRSRAKRGPIASQYRVGYYEPVVSTEHTSLSPRSSSITGQSDQCEEVSGDNLEITGLLQRLGLLETKESEN